GSPLSRSLLGAKRTSSAALHMSAYDPKRTWRLSLKGSQLNVYDALLGFGEQHEATRLHSTDWRRGGSLATDGTWSAARDAADRRAHEYFRKGPAISGPCLSFAAWTGGTRLDTGQQYAD